MGRLLVATADPDLFLNVQNLQGRRVRHKEGDRVFHTIREAKKALKEIRDKPVLVAETGKVLVGRTIVIRCQWRGKDGQHGKRCSNTRTIKTQDRFQVRYCVEHQRMNRRNIRNAKARAKTAQQRELVGQGV